MARCNLLLSADSVLMCRAIAFVHHWVSVLNRLWDRGVMPRTMPVHGVIVSDYCLVRWAIANVLNKSIEFANAINSLLIAPSFSMRTEFIAVAITFGVPYCQRSDVRHSHSVSRYWSSQSIDWVEKGTLKYHRGALSDAALSFV